MSAPVDVIFDSNFADNSKKENPEYIMAPPLDNVVGYQVQWATVPFSYYVIDRYNNEFSFAIKTGGDYVYSTCRITPGSYNPQSLANEMKRMFATEVTSFPTVGAAIPHGGSMVVDVDNSNGRLIMYNNNYDTTAVGNEDFRIQVDNEDLARILGFVRGVQYISVAEQLWRNGGLVTNSADATTNKVAHIRAPYIANLTYSSRLNLHGQFGGSSPGNSRTQDGNTDMFLTIPVLSNFSSFINYQNVGQPIMISRCSVSRISFYLTLGGRRFYAKNSLDYDTPSADLESTTYLPLNGEGFQVCIRFLVDDGATVSM